MSAITMAMKRTTIMADNELLDRLREIARREGCSLGAVIREGLELRVRQRPRRPSFIGAFASEDGPHDLGERSADLPYEPLSWR